MSAIPYNSITMSDQEKLSNQEESHVDAKTIANRKKREKKKAKAAAAATVRVLLTKES